jgi:predicted nucleotidyltransferase
MGIEQIQDSLKILVAKLKEKYTPEQIILFGSYAKGTADAASDVDLLVVSPLFKNRDIYDVYSELYGLTSDFEKDIQVFGISKEDILKYNTFRQAIETGIVVS